MRRDGSVFGATRSSASHTLVLLAAAFGTSAVACGGAAPPPAAPTSTTAAPPPAKVTEQAADLSPVAEPKSLIALGRWKNVSATLASVEKMMKLPLGLQKE